MICCRLRCVTGAAAMLGFMLLAAPPVGSGPPVLTDAYVLRGGQAFGQVIVVGTISQVATAELNPNTLADGVAAPADSECSKVHYVGLLNGADTPSDGNGQTSACGWGKLSLVPAGLNAVQSYATAWTATQTAHRVLIGLRDLGGTTYADAAQQVVLSLAALQLLRQQVADLKQAGVITGDDKQKILNKLEKAEERLGFAAAGLATLASNPAIESREGTLLYFATVRQLVLAEDGLTKMLKRMKNAGLLPGAD